MNYLFSSNLLERVHDNKHAFINFTWLVCISQRRDLFIMCQNSFAYRPCCLHPALSNSQNSFPAAKFKGEEVLSERVPRQSCWLHCSEYISAMILLFTSNVLTHQHIEKSIPIHAKRESICSCVRSVNNTLTGTCTMYSFWLSTWCPTHWD